MSTEVQPPRQVVVVSATKSVGISILLTFLFGPLGMLYSTIPGAIIMAILSVIIGVITFGFGFLLTWPVCMIWGAVATSSYNKKLLASATVARASPIAQEPTAQRSELSGLGFDADAEQKRCPACAEQIKLEALKCKHCGELLDPAAVRAEIALRRAAFEQSATARLISVEAVGRPSPEVPTHLEPEAGATATVAEPPARDSGTREIPTSQPPSQSQDSPMESPKIFGAAPKPWIIGGAAVVIVALAIWAGIQLARPRNTPSRVTQDGTEPAGTAGRLGGIKAVAHSETGTHELNEYLGTWTDNDNAFLLEIAATNGRIRIRAWRGDSSATGTEFFARFANGSIIAVGDPRDFYKFQFPEFKLVGNGELLQECGACGPDERYKRTTRQMPDISFEPPVNND